MEPNRRFTGKAFLKHSTPCVYGWKRDDKFLYIGATLHGLSRLFTHHAIHCMDAVRPTDLFLFWDASSKDVHALERHLIGKHDPLFNGVSSRPVPVKPPRIMQQRAVKLKRLKVKDSIKISDGPLTAADLQRWYRAANEAQIKVSIRNQYREVWLWRTQ